MRLHYDRSRSDLFFYLLTLVGIGLLVVFRIQGDVDLSHRPAPAGAGGAGAPPLPTDGEHGRVGAADGATRRVRIGPATAG